MIDPQWFMRTMMGDNIIVRLELLPLPGNRAHVLALAFTYWLDDAHYNCAEVVYGNDPRGEAYRPLELIPFNGSPDDWKKSLEGRAGEWLAAWQENVPVICTKRGQVLAPSHPEVLSHLARFEGMALETARNAGTFDRITYDIVARRIGGVVNSASNSWKQLLYQSK